MFKEILVLAPHLDDVELGAGGTIAKLIEEERNVTYMTHIYEHSTQRHSR